MNEIKYTRCNNLIKMSLDDLYDGINNSYNKLKENIKCLEDLLSKFNESMESLKKIFANHLSTKEYLSKMYKELLHSNNGNTNNPILF